jgi:hypothetical protein
MANEGRHSTCKLEGASQRPYLEAYKRCNGGLCILKFDMKDRQLQGKLILPPCPVCGNPLGTSELKRLLLAQTDIEKEIAGIEATSEALYKTHAINYDLIMALRKALLALKREGQPSPSPGKPTATIAPNHTAGTGETAAQEKPESKPPVAQAPREEEKVPLPQATNGSKHTQPENPNPNPNPNTNPKPKPVPSPAQPPKEQSTANSPTS